MLAPKLLKFTPKALREELHAMFRGYASGEPRSVHFDEEFQMKSWPS